MHPVQLHKDRLQGFQAAPGSTHQVNSLPAEWQS